MFFFRQFRDTIEVCDTEYEDSDPESSKNTYEPVSDDDSDSDSDSTKPGSSDEENGFSVSQSLESWKNEHNYFRNLMPRKKLTVFLKLCDCYYYQWKDIAT